MASRVTTGDAREPHAVKWDPRPTRATSTVEKRGGDTKKEGDKKREPPQGSARREGDGDEQPKGGEGSASTAKRTL